MQTLKLSSLIAKRDSRAILSYYREINRYPVLNPDQEYEMAKLAQAGDKKAKEYLLKCNLRLVISVSNRFLGHGLDQMDLIAEGNLGLLKALDHYDCDRGFRFCTYAVNWILKSVISAIESKGKMVAIPANKNADIRRVKRFESRFEAKNGYRPSEEEIAAGLVLPEKYVEELMSINGYHLSIDSPIKEGESQTYLDVMEAERVPDFESGQDAMIQDINRAVSMLQDRERNIICLSFGLNGQVCHSLSDVADIIGMSVERVRQLRNHAIRALMSSPHASNLKTYLAV